MKFSKKKHHLKIHLLCVQLNLTVVQLQCNVDVVETCFGVSLEAQRFVLDETLHILVDAVDTSMFRPAAENLVLLTLEMLNGSIKKFC